MECDCTYNFSIDLIIIKRLKISVKKSEKLTKLFWWKVESGETLRMKQRFFGRCYFGRSWLEKLQRSDAERVWQLSASWGSIGDTPEIPRTITALYHTEGLKESHHLLPHYAERLQSLGKWIWVFPTSFFFQLFFSVMIRSAIITFRN